MKKIEFIKIILAECINSQLIIFVDSFLRGRGCMFSHLVIKIQQLGGQLQHPGGSELVIGLVLPEDGIGCTVTGLLRVASVASSP